MDVVDNPIINQLVPLYRDPNFDTIFQKLTANESANTRFLIKMELNRRYSPCVRVIDFRDTDPSCQKYVILGVTHYLGKEDLKAFADELKLYHGEYTMGVYENIIAQHKLRKANKIEKEDQISLETQISRYEVDTVNFASYFYRSEERMHYSSPAVLLLENGETVSVKTSDLSCGGLKLTLEKEIEYENRQPCWVTFTGLQKLIADPNNKLDQAPYLILNQQKKNEKTSLILVKADKDQVFAQLIDDFIQQNKLKYSVSVDNLLLTVETKGYEQFYMPRTTALPLFFDKAASPKLIFTLKSENNQGILEYWRDERNDDKLPSLFNQKRMQIMMDEINRTGSYETFIYCFRHMVRSHIFFFSATMEELEQTNTKELFFMVGSKRPSWRVYKFSFEKSDIDDQNVSQYIEDTVQQVDRERVTKELLKIGYTGQLIEVKSDEQGLSDYRAITLEQFNANELQIFAHNLAVEPCRTEMLHYIKMRKEPRYIHKTAVALKLANGVSVVGWTKDISTMGLQLELAESVPCNKDDIVHLTLPKLQSLTKDLKLKDLPYRVVHTNQSQTIIHLTIEGDPDTHVGRKFFDLLIENNHDTLATSKELQNLSTLSKSLRYLFTQHIFTCPLYMCKSKPNRLGAIGRIGQPRTVYNLFSELISDDSSKFNVYPMLHDKLLRRVLLDPLREMQRFYSPRETVVFISRCYDHNNNICYDTMIDEDFSSYDEKRNFCSKALERNHLYVLKLFITRTGKPDIDYIAKELNYISKYAIHKAKRFEDTIWSIIGICDIVDITAETLYVLGLPCKAV